MMILGHHTRWPLIFLKSQVLRFYLCIILCGPTLRDLSGNCWHFLLAQLKMRSFDPAQFANTRKCVPWLALIGSSNCHYISPTSSPDTRLVLGGKFYRVWKVRFLSHTRQIINRSVRAADMESKNGRNNS